MTPDETGALSRGLLLLEILGQSWDAPEREKEIKYVRNWQEFLKEDGDVGGDAFLSKQKKKKNKTRIRLHMHASIGLTKLVGKNDFGNYRTNLMLWIRLLNSPF